MIWFLSIPALWWWIIAYHFRTCADSSIFESDHCWPHDPIMWIFFVGMSLVFLFLNIMLVAGFARFVGHVLSQGTIWRYKLQYTEELVAIRDKDGVSGSMHGGLFLFSGYIQNTPYYQFYRRESDGSLVPDKVDCSNNVKIFEEDRPDAKLVVYGNECPGWYWIFGFMDDGEWKYEFHVPKGTVRLGYSM